MFNAALEGAQANVEGGNVHTLSDGSKYSDKKSFGEQVADTLDGEMPANQMLYVRSTPDVFVDIGIPKLPMLMDQRHVDSVYYKEGKQKNTNYHGMGVMLNTLPDALEKPLAIIRSKSHTDSSVVALTGIQNQNGHTVIVPVNLDFSGYYENQQYDAYKISTMFPKENAWKELFSDALKAEERGEVGVFYFDKENGAQMATNQGLQLPKRVASGGHIHSISDPRSPVKLKISSVTQSQQFKRWFKGSKAVNEDGTPKVVYHGTGANFNVFGNEGENTPGSVGYYFTDDPEVAEGYAQRSAGDARHTMKTYIQLRNPVEFDATDFANGF